MLVPNKLYSVVPHEAIRFVSHIIVVVIKVNKSRLEE